MKLKNDLGNKDIFSKNLSFYLKINDISRIELSKVLKIPYSTLSDWINGKKYPRIDKIELLADYFSINKSDLIEDKKTSLKNDYYIEEKNSDAEEYMKNNKVSDFPTRLKKIMEIKNLKQSDISRITGIRSSSISDWINRKYDAKQDKIDIIANKLNISPSYLMGYDVTYNNENIYDYNDDNYDYNTFEYDYIPDGIAAGLPMGIDGITEFEKVTISDIFLGKYARNKNIKISYASGESMNNIIPNGSLIAFLTNINIQNLKDGDIVIFRDNYEYSIKHFYKTDKMLIFRPDSSDKAFTDIIYNIEDIEEINIIGKLVAYNIILN